MTSRSQKRHHSVDSAPDLISHLPADLTVKILLCLPLQEAVKTSLLSKGWRYKWITIPHLLFDSSTFCSASKHSLPPIRKILAIIHIVLSQHEGSISKFMLSVPRPLPSRLFSDLEMRFAKLKSLKLCDVRLPDNFGKIFVSNCPLLECLKLHSCTNIDSVDFYAPNLKLLDYTGSLLSLNFKNSPSLKKVSIDRSYIFRNLPFMNISWIDAFRSLPSLEYLQIGSRLISELDSSIARDMVASHLNCLVTLVVSLYFGYPSTTWLTRCSLCLIKSSPNLQKLVIEFTPLFTEEDDGSEIQLSKLEESFDLSFEKLQYVEVSCFVGVRLQVALIELLLAKSPMLETVHIFHPKWWRIDNKFRAQVNQVPRASPRAKVIFMSRAHHLIFPS